MSAVVHATAMVAFGAAEGFCFALSGMADPTSFRMQMVFSKNILLKVFVAAVGSSMFFQALFALAAPKRFHDTRHYKYQSAGFARVMGGCLLLGSGMAIAGTGPTMMPSQIGASVSSAVYLVLGALAGGAAFAVLEELNLAATHFTERKENLVLEDIVGSAYEPLALGAGLAMLAGDYYFSTRIWPDRFDAQPGNFVPPIVAGMAVGLSQIPLRLLNGGGQGGSRSIMNLIAGVTGGKLSGRFAIKNIKQAGQLIYVWGGTLLGSFLACRMYNLASPTGYSPAASFFGAALALFGSRMAGGCACGHGVTGFSELGLESMAGAACIFAGGIATMLFSSLSA
jgi:hypothetical protein